MGERPWAVLITSGLVAVGSLLPWVDVGLLSAAGTEGDGVFTLAGGVVAFGVALAQGRRSSTRATAVVVGVIGLWITGSILADINAEFAGSGLLLTLLASGALALAGLTTKPSPASGEADSHEAPKAAQPPVQTRLSELERLADLRDRGLLTEGELEAAKREILGSREEDTAALPLPGEAEAAYRIRLAKEGHPAEKIHELAVQHFRT